LGLYEFLLRAKKFSSEQAIAASGLKPGQEFSVKDLDAAAERFGKSGAFPDVSYSYLPQGGNISVEFTVQEAAKFRECVFDNFVWLSRDEIQTGLRKDVPLYIGVAPETGEILDEISRGLEKLSQEKGITVQVQTIQQFSTNHEQHATSWISPDIHRSGLEQPHFVATGTVAVAPAHTNAAKHAAGEEGSYACVRANIRQWTRGAI
jgi:hypothetical protein